MYNELTGATMPWGIQYIFAGAEQTAAADIELAVEGSL